MWMLLNAYFWSRSGQTLAWRAANMLFLKPYFGHKVSPGGHTSEPRLDWRWRCSEYSWAVCTRRVTLTLSVTHIEKWSSHWHLNAAEDKTRHGCFALTLYTLKHNRQCYVILLVREYALYKHKKNPLDVYAHTQYTYCAVHAQVCSGVHHLLLLSWGSKLWCEGDHDQHAHTCWACQV